MPGKKTLTNAQWAKVQEEYEANVLSKTDIAKKYGISRQVLHAKAKRAGWEQAPKSERASKVKQRIVEEAMSLGQIANPENSKRIIEEAVNQDVDDMNKGLRNARRALDISYNMMEVVAGEDGNPIALKSLVDTTKQSIEVIRKIRGLDEKESESEFDQMSYDDLQAEYESLKAELDAQP